MKKMQECSIEDALQLQQDFEHWFQTFLGRLLLNAERISIDNRVLRLFGYQQIDLALSHRLPVASHSMLGNKIMVVPQWQSALPENVVVSNTHELPFAHESCDLVVLHHTLDFSPNPHQSLREVSRILKSGGHVVIVGFNPISLWGLRRLFSKFSAGAPWTGRFISGKRLEDWLGLLDFDISSCDYAFYRWPSSHQVFNGFFEFLDRYVKFKLPIGAFYTLVAKKQVGGMIVIRQQWKRAKVVGLPIINRVQSRNVDDD
jgi:SAM-dependent methyltransferase